MISMDIPLRKLEHTRFALPELGLGTWQMGGRREADFSKDKEDIAAIKAAITAGITHLDTAEVYGAGHTEELVREGIKGVNRKTLFITSKVKENSRKSRILEACEQSLKRLGTGYLDLYLLHHYSTDCPLAESIEALDELVSKKLVRHIGVSNFSKEHLKEAQKLTKHKIVCDQVYYNLASRQPEATGLLDYCQKHGVLLVAYRPVEKGRLLEGLPPVMGELCRKYEKTPAQIAINWLISQPNVVTIFKTSNAAHLKENLGSLGWNLTEEDIERLRKEYPQNPPPPEGEFVRLSTV
jgi:diketogulonate reductase-like aldo/keto reductase